MAIDLDSAKLDEAHQAGARFMAAHVNPAMKQLGDGLALVRELAKVIAGSQTEMLTASLKSTKEAGASHVAGVQHVTVPLDLLTSLSSHPLPVQTVEQLKAYGVGIRSNYKELTWKK